MKRDPILILAGAVLIAFSVTSTAIASNISEKDVEICGSCHGKDGNPSDPGIPVLWGQSQSYLEKQLDDFRNGDRDSQIMASVAESLKKEDIPAFAAYFAHKQWPQRANKSTAMSPPDDVALCQSCHQANFLGGLAPNGTAPRLAGQSQKYLDDTIRSFAREERGNSADMSAIAKTLSANQREDLARYLSGL